MIKVIADNPEQQDLADYLEEIAQPYIRLVQQSTFDSLVDGRVRAVIVEVIDDEINYRIIFPEEDGSKYEYSNVYGYVAIKELE